MDIFFLLVTTAIPLLFLIALGFFAGRKMHMDTMTLANLVIYILAPVINFGAMTKLEFDTTYLLLPVILYVIAASISIISYKIARATMQDNRANIVGIAAGSGNTGFFGLPIVLVLFGTDVLGIYLLMNLAIGLCEATVGYYLAMHGQSSARESIRKVLKLPHLYAVAAGLAVNYAGITMPEAFYTYWDKFVGSWILIGMMMMGVTLAKIQTFTVNWPLTKMLLSARFVFWPIMTFLFVLLDRHVLNLFNNEVHAMLLIIASVPLAVSTVSFSIKLDLKAGDAAIAVLISTLIAIFYLPLVLLLTGVVG